MNKIRFGDSKRPGFSFIILEEPFDDVRKEMVVQEARCFNDNNLNVRNCLGIISKLIYLINQGEKFLPSEIETLFFDSTKLLQTNDIELRRMVYFILRVLNEKQNYSFVVTSMLMNDINKNNDMYRANSFRMLGQIINSNDNINLLERYLKNAISDNNPAVSCSAIICALKLAYKGIDVAKNWITEITDKLNSSTKQSNLLTFHTLLLLYEIKKNDKLYLIKLFQNMIQSNLKSQFANCQLIRMVINLIKSSEIESQSVLNIFYTFLEQNLFKNNQEAVSLEAIRGILELPNPKDDLLKKTFVAAQMLLSSSKNLHKFAALRTLDRVAKKYSKIAYDIFLDLEKIIDDTTLNMSIKTIAISIFLKISEELSNSRLEKLFQTICEQYSVFKEEFKKEIISISRNICKDHPNKQSIYFSFFNKCLKFEGSVQTKNEIIDAIIWFINNNTEFKKQALLNLSEFIEDCQFDQIKTKILDILGREGSSLKNPSILIRHIYNRIILENPIVRASAITSLSEIANREPKLRKNVILLIKNCLNDSDDEVRERAYFYFKAFSDESAASLIFGPKTLNIENLQLLIQAQKEFLLKSNDIVGDIRNLMNDPSTLEKLASTRKHEIPGKITRPHDKKFVQEKKNEEEEKSSKDDLYFDFRTTSFYKKLGLPRLCTQFQRLNDQYAEYVVSIRKIVYDDVVILDFEFTNTMDDFILKNITLDITDISNIESFEFNKTEIIEIDSLKSKECKHIYLKLIKREKYSHCSFVSLFKYTVQEKDAKGNIFEEYKDTLKIEKRVEVKVSDYFVRNTQVFLNNFDEFWKLAEKNGYPQESGTYNLPYTSVKQVGKSISELFGINCLNDVEKIENDIRKYEFFFASVSYDSVPVFLKVQVGINENKQCLGKFIIRSVEEELCEQILNSLIA